MVSLPSIQSAAQSSCPAPLMHVQQPAQHAQHAQVSSWSNASQQAQQAQRMQPRAWPHATQHLQQPWQAQLMHQRPSTQLGLHAQHLQNMQQAEQAQHVPWHCPPQVNAECSWSEGSIPSAMSGTTPEGWLQPALPQGHQGQVHHTPQNFMQQQHSARTVPWVQHTWFPALPGGYQDDCVQPTWHTGQQPLQQRLAGSLPQQQQLPGVQHHHEQQQQDVHLYSSQLAVNADHSNTASSMAKLGSYRTQLCRGVPSVVGLCNARSSKSVLPPKRSTKFQQLGSLQQQEPGLIKAYNLNALLA